MPATQPKLFMEDLKIGDRFVSGEHRLDAEQIKLFARQFDPQPFHLDEEEARSTFFQGLAASGWHTAAITMKLLVPSVPLAEGIIGAGGEISWTPLSAAARRAAMPSLSSERNTSGTKRMSLKGPPLAVICDAALTRPLRTLTQPRLPAQVERHSVNSPASQR